MIQEIREKSSAINIKKDFSKLNVDRNEKDEKKKKKLITSNNVESYSEVGLRMLESR